MVIDVRQFPTDQIVLAVDYTSFTTEWFPAECLL